jgi:hypothetical protein
MQGPVTIDVIKNSKTGSALALTICEWLGDYCKGLKSSEGKWAAGIGSILSTQDRFVGIDNGSIVCAERDVVDDNIVEDGSERKPLPFRYFSHKVISFFEVKKNLPDVVFDGEKGWCGEFRELSSELKQQVSIFQPLVHNVPGLRKSLRIFSIEAKDIEFRNNIEKIIYLLKMIEKYERKHQVSLISDSVVPMRR